MSECLIVKGSGETDLPIVHIVHSLEEARHAVLSLMYSNPADAEDTDELFAEFDDTMADDNYWTIAFEIGGISVERVCLSAAPTQGADGESLRPVASAIEWIEETCAAYCIPKPFAIIETLQAARATPADHSRDSVIEECCAAIKAEDDRMADEDYMLDSDDCIRVCRALKSQQDAAIESQRSGDGESS